jgi:hypothetical protein
MSILIKAQLIEDGFNFPIPMLQTTAKPIQCALEEPLFIFGCFWISDGWLDNLSFVGREDALTKCVFTIPLFESAAVFKGHT